MPRDQRLFMTFPIDFWTHPKVSRLSDAAFRAFVEANGHSRMRETDGVIESDDAEFLWKPEALSELVASHPSRPLMVRSDAGEYVLRDYAEHQFTKADRDSLSEKRSAAGARGAQAKASKRLASAEQVLSKPEQVPSKVQQAQAGIGIGTEIEKINPSPAPTARPSLFDAAYDFWPKKVDRKDAAVRWPRAVKEFGGSESELVEIVKVHAEAYAAHKSKQFTPSLLVWLNKNRWDNELPTSDAQERQPAVVRNLSVVEQFRQMEISA